MVKNVLFITYGGGHVNIVREIALELQNRADFHVEILALTVAFKVLEENNLPYKKISDYLFLFEDIGEKVEEYGRLLAKTTYDPRSGIEFTDNVAYLGLSFYDLVQSMGSEANALSLYNEKGRSIFNPVATMRRILEYEKPDLVVLTAGVRMEKGAGIAANQLGVPVVLIRDLPEGERKEFNSQICVMNEFSKNYYIHKLELPPETVTVTGQPVFERNEFIDLMELERIKKGLCLDTFQHLTVLLLQPKKKDDALLWTFSQIAKDHHEDLFVVKLHPNQILEEISIKERHNLKIIRDIPIKYLLHLSSLVITFYSTAGLEAALLDKDLIVIETEKLEIDYSAYGIAEKITDLRHLEDLIYERLFKETETKKRLARSRQLFNNNENATRNIIKVFNKLLNN